MPELTELEWNVLSSISDDREAVALIKGSIGDSFSHISQKELAESVYALYQRGLLYEFHNETVDFETLINEPADYAAAAYWFGLTALGCKYWEEYAPVYQGEPVNWSNAYSSSVDFKTKKGSIACTSEEVGLRALKTILRDDEPWQVDITTVTSSKIKGFKAKYYKYIEGGYLFTFDLLKKTPNNTHK